MKKKIQWLLLQAVMLLCCIRVYAQTDTAKIQHKSSNNSKVQSIRNVEKAQKKADNKSAALQWEQLGKQFELEGDLLQANTYYMKAIDAYKLEKDEKSVSRIYRSIAYNEERLKQTQNAAASYKNAEKYAPSAADRIINNNDVKRMESNSTVESSALLELNEDIAIKENNTAEIAKISQQKARIAVENNDASMAQTIVDKAAHQSSNQQELIEIRGALAKKFADAHLIDSAILLTQHNSREAYDNQLWTTYFDLQKQLAAYYSQKNENDSSMQILKNAISQAFTINYTSGVIDLNQHLRNYYIANGQKDLAYASADSLLAGIIQLVKGDSTLWNQALFAEIAQKVQVLENEKEVQSALIAKTQTFNWVLLITLLILLLGVFYIIRMVLKLRKKNQKIALQSLRREMNPHFIFNSLNSVNQYIALNDPIAANQYLSSYSKLMRNVMASGAKDFVKVMEEFEQLEQYVAIEALRFKEQFEYEMVLDEGLELNLIPNMIIQPFIENAVWHGLRYKSSKGQLDIHFKNINDNHFEVVIMDNGIGMEESKAAKTKFQKTYESRGLKNIDERIYLLNQLYRLNISYVIKTPENNIGTIVKILFPKKTSQTLAYED